jgi:hypothetical protein
MKLTILALAFFGLTLPAFGQQAVGPEGIYQLNLAKSTIRGPSLNTQVVKFERDKLTTVGFDPDGKPYTLTVGYVVDGKPRPVTGSPAYDMTTYTQVDPYTVSISRTKNGKVVESGHRIFNPDSKTIMFSISATDGSYSHVYFYEKQ